MMLDLIMPFRSLILCWLILSLLSQTSKFFSSTPSQNWKKVCKEGVRIWKLNILHSGLVSYQVLTCCLKLSHTISIFDIFYNERWHSFTSQIHASCPKFRWVESSGEQFCQKILCLSHPDVLNKHYQGWDQSISKFGKYPRWF